ncbi:MAG: malto-oligosyltrehalose trehalohydrolase [Rhodospirillales bacterium]|nr:malto-oligosyltrehalose trehalohydrolase [Rhodospirillales bacterium]
MAARFAHALPFGANPQPNGTTRFRLWAPSIVGVALQIDGRGAVPMQEEAGGWHVAEVVCGPGTRYRYRLPDGMLVPDPASRLQHGDVHGWSVVFDPRAHEWHFDDWNGRPWHEAVVYELHVGALGGFRGVSDRLDGLRDLGVTAIELMPIADFPGTRNWGYDGVLPFAPDAAYGAPGELKTMIDRAHGLGLMVLLDVVYNHFGADGNFLHEYAEAFFDQGAPTPWGAAIAFRRREVRDFFTHNALYWLNEYRFDGLRFDAAHAIVPQQALLELAAGIRAGVAAGRHVHLVLEHEGNRASLLGAGKFDAQWADDAHHCLHVLLTGETEGYYGDYPDPAAQLARALRHGFAYQGEVSPRGRRRGEPSGELPPSCFVFCLQNHDQIGNRALGERLTLLADPEALRAARALLLLAPQIPLLFMGEEYASRAPFLYFTDHNPELARLVRDGRRREFAHFAAFADERRRARIPDPNAPGTFALSVPDPADADPQTLAETRLLLGLRTRHIVPRIPGCRSLMAGPVGETGVLARWRMGDGAELAIACNLGATPLPIDPVDGPMLFESRAGDADAVREGHLPARCTVAFLLGGT